MPLVSLRNSVNRSSTRVGTGQPSCRETSDLGTREVGDEQCFVVYRER